MPIHKPLTPKARVVAALGAGTLVTASALGAVASASAQTITQPFDVTCTQPNVNGGAPFTVGTVAEVVLPDVIHAGDEVFPEVVVDLELPIEVANAVLSNGYETLEGFVDVTVSVTDPDGVSAPLSASDFPLPVTPVPNPAAAFSISTAPAFPSYTFAGPGTYNVSVAGDAVTLTGVVVRNSAGGWTQLSNFSCSVEGEIDIGAIEVVETPAGETPVTPPVPGGTPVTPPVPGEAPRLPVVSG